MKNKIPKPCRNCEHWKQLSQSYRLCCCHSLLDTGRRRGMNKEGTECTTWEKRKGSGNNENKKQNSEDA